MFFRIDHRTEYTYSEPATESFSELRLRPRDSLRQKVSRHVTTVRPKVLINHFTDYYGNYVETVSVPFKHNKLVVHSSCMVETNTYVDAMRGLNLSISEASYIYLNHKQALYEFMRPSIYIPFSRGLKKLASELLRPERPFSEALLALNHHIYTHFKYKPGVTDASSTVQELLDGKEGVCQDFAHLMICLCRNAGIPARYISGYIETDPVPKPEGNKAKESTLIGATASHAWVEVYTPNLFWVGLDPTNDIMEGERHVQIGVGRDYGDVTPLKGVFKGASQQVMSVDVKVTRDQPLREN